MTATYGALLFAGECFFGASLILGLAWLITRQGSASQRHFVWTSAFIAMLVLPPAAAVVPAHIVFHLPAAPVVNDAAVLSAAAATPVAAAPAPIFTLEHAVQLLFVLWAAGVVAIAARTAFGLFALYLLHRRSVPHIPNGIDGEKFRGPYWQLRIRTAPGNEGPITYGLMKSTVLLPKASVRWPRAQLEAVLLHEFAHVCRKDCLTRLIALTACAFYWPNPFVWSAAARMRRDAEIAADDAVLQSGVRASSYADALVGLARDFGHDHPAYAGVGLSMAERSGLKDRVQAILSAAQPRMGVSHMDMLKVVALGAAVTAGLVLARPSLADAVPDAAPVTSNDLPPAPPPPPDAAPEAPPAPPAVAAPPAPPAPPHHLAHVMRFHTPNGDRVVQWDGDTEMSPEDQKVLLKTHKSIVELDKHHDQVVVIDRGEIDKAMADAMKAQHDAMVMSRAEMHRAMEEAMKAQHLNHAEIRAAVKEAQASRVRALEHARDEIERQLERARKEEADAKRDTDSDGK